MLKLENGTFSFYQWDLDQRFIVTEINGPASIHFWQDGLTDALVVDPYEEDGKTLADVPNILLQKASPITAYIYREDIGAYTSYKRIFQVYEREKPAGYVYTETEARTWEALDKRIKELEENGAGGAGAMFVTFTITSTGKKGEDYGKATADKTFQECLDAYNNGAHVCGTCNDGSVFWGNCAYGEYDGDEGVMFFNLWDDTSTSVIRIMMCESNECFVLTESDQDIVVNNEGKYGATKLATAKYVRGELFKHAIVHERLGEAISDIEADLRENTKAIADMQPIRVTITKQGDKYVASKTHQELMDILAENEHRSIICDFNGMLLPLSMVSGLILIFSAANTIWTSITVEIANVYGCDIVTVYNDEHSIEINGQLWDADDPNADFTDTINGMIDDKIGEIETALDELHAYAQALVNGGAGE